MSPPCSEYFIKKNPSQWTWLKIIVGILRVVPVAQPSVSDINALVVVFGVLWSDVMLEIYLVRDARDALVVVLHLHHG